MIRGSNDNQKAMFNDVHREFDDQRLEQLWRHAQTRRLDYVSLVKMYDKNNRHYVAISFIADIMRDFDMIRALRDDGKWFPDPEEEEFMEKQRKIWNKAFKCR